MKSRWQNAGYVVGVAVGVLAAISLPITFWIIKSSAEAATFSRLTGTHASTWDAMWTELRVQAPPLK